MLIIDEVYIIVRLTNFLFRGRKFAEIYDGNLDEQHHKIKDLINYT